MIDIEKRELLAQKKAKTRQRMQVRIDPDNYEYIPAEKETDYYDNDICFQRQLHPGRTGLLQMRSYIGNAKNLFCRESSHNRLPRIQ